MAMAIKLSPARHRLSTCSNPTKLSLPLRPCRCTSLRQPPSSVPNLVLVPRRGDGEGEQEGEVESHGHGRFKPPPSREGLKQAVGWSKGWLGEGGKEDGLLLAQLRLIAAMAKDRVELHGNIGQQRDSWNKLFQATISSATMAAAVLAVLGGAGAPWAAFALNAGIAALMLFLSRFQPSQLAEEQRNAARLFRQLADDIDYTLQIAPSLRQEATTYLARCQSRLLALDKAFPLPLYPNGLEKFPESIVLPALSDPADASACIIELSGPENGWTNEMCDELLRVARLAATSDARNYVEWAGEKLRTNRVLAIAAPGLAAAGAAVNLADALFGVGNLGAAAAVLPVLAALAGSVAHDGQLGMVFEMYRVCAGYFVDMEKAVERAARTPVEERENGLLFYQRVAYGLGRDPSRMPLVPPDSNTAGVLF